VTDRAHDEKSQVYNHHESGTNIKGFSSLLSLGQLEGDTAAKGNWQTPQL